MSGSSLYIPDEIKERLRELDLPHWSKFTLPDQGMFKLFLMGKLILRVDDLNEAQVGIAFLKIRAK